MAAPSTPASTGASIDEPLSALFMLFTPIKVSAMSPLTPSRSSMSNHLSFARHGLCAGLLPSLLLSLSAGAAQAHISITTSPASAGGYAKVVLQVPHGCSGSPTTALTVYLPPAYLVAKPMPKPGWTVTIQKARLAQPIQLHGRTIEDSPSVIRWEGGSLPSDFFEEFALQGKLDERAAGPLTFRTVQTCEKGEVDWNGAPGSATPAPALQVTPSISPAPASPSSAPPSPTPHQHAH
ncbi:MAG: DUF1775 domain-containing protein [Rubrivivax sp.]|nr:MAG: DUF1775 domain-containing protein [Rubrivivax sp.]